jgi:biotin carboxylase
MENKKILILGMSHSQLDLAEAAKQRGLTVYSCAMNTEGPVKLIADEYVKLDILDVQGVLRYAKEKHVDAVYTLGLESALPTIAEVSERLKLPTFVTTNNLMNFKDKAVWRKKLAGVQGNLPFLLGSTLEMFDMWNDYPAVLKPVDGSGQRGVTEVRNFDELVSNFEWSKKHSKSGELILEKYAQGDEISVNTFMLDGKLQFAIMSDRLSHSEYPGGIIKEHHIPSKYENDDTISKVDTLVKTVNSIMGFENGHVYFQLKVKGKDVNLIEFTPRFDGCHMWRLIKEAYGIDLLGMSLDYLLGNEMLLGEQAVIKEINKKYVLKFNSDKPGTVVNYNNYNFEKNTRFNYWYYNEGQKIGKITGFLEKVGYYIYSIDK